MSTAARYVMPGDTDPLSPTALKKAGLRDNSVKSLQAAVKDFREGFRSVLPATPATLENYIAWSVQQNRAPSTIAQRVSLLGSWHTQMGFANPTLDAGVKAALKGVKTLNRVPPQQATPLTFAQLEYLVAHLEQEIRDADNEEKRLTVESPVGEAPDTRALRATALRALRDRAILLTGFWFAYRPDELSRLNFRWIRFTTGEATAHLNNPRVMDIGFPYTKGDREAEGRSRSLPELPRLCPVNAMLDWRAAHGHTEGPVFMGINRWGQVKDKATSPNQASTWLRSLMTRASLETQGYSAYSLRRGFATFADSRGATSGELTKWVEWQSTQTAEKYIERSSPLPIRLLASFEN